MAASPPTTIEPVTLEGRVVRLEPLGIEHVGRLAEIGLDPELWRWIAFPVRTEEGLHAYVEEALRDRAAGRAMPFATVLQQTGQPIGSTRFGNVDLFNRRVEIGWTWVGRAWQRSAVNTEAKLLMLEHAFERLGCNRVEFKTDALNEQSRNALRGIGAVEEGVLRDHMVTETVRLRSSVYYSVLRSEWPAVEAHLRERLSRPRRPTSAGD